MTSQLKVTYDVIYLFVCGCDFNSLKNKKTAKGQIFNNVDLIAEECNYLPAS